MFLSVLLRSTSAEGFQLLAVHFQLAVFPQDFQLYLQVLDLRFHVVQLGEKSSAVSVFRYSCLLYLIRLNTILGYHILCDTGELHIATVNSILNKPVRGFYRPFFYLRPRHIDPTALILCDAVLDRFSLVKPPKRFRSGHLRSRIAFFLLRKHKFQVDLVGWVVLDKHSEIGALPKEIIEVLALFYDLIYREFQLCFPR